MRNKNIDILPDSYKAFFSVIDVEDIEQFTEDEIDLLLNTLSVEPTSHNEFEIFLENSLKIHSESSKDNKRDTNEMFDLMSSFSQNAVIKVMGVGGGGGNAVQHMVDSTIEGVEFICVNTDVQALKRMDAKTSLQIGSSITKGLGALQ